MGKRIQSLMKEVKSYKDAAKVTRNISKHIQYVFSDVALKEVEDNIMNFLELAHIDKKNKDYAFRRIINAGDDITFVCNASIALNCVKAFMNALEKEGTYNACAGIYVTHSHFSFSRAYEYAEELCSNAKKLSRKQEGNYTDFHVNYNGLLNDLDTIREKQYTDVQGNLLIARPYSIDTLNVLMNVIKQLNDTHVSRTKLKELREAFHDGEEVLEKEIARINSRLSKKINVKDYRLLFDAIDIMDLKWGEVYE